MMLAAEVISCFKYCNTSALSLLMAACSLGSKKLQSAAHCMASASLPSLAFCRAVLISAAAVSLPRDSPFGMIVRRATSSGRSFSASQDFTADNPSARDAVGVNIDKATRRVTEYFQNMNL